MPIAHSVEEALAPSRRRAIAVAAEDTASPWEATRALIRRG